ncbi:hypothetical protein [Synechococcus sp. RSCCF101]|uniref:hypothetical protein n=1 Tax=Synechococcus sp. RSCCF101 TaxID=2511069 RepID=UPI001CD97D5F|nr:hypothetical protein [Synechococcus sp. RSCCF101]
MTHWSEAEQAVARSAFDLARRREAALLLETVQQHSASATDLDAIWQLHDYLSARRFEHEGKYVFDLDDILFLFASNLKDGVLAASELEGLSADKIAKIIALSKMA